MKATKKIRGIILFVLIVTLTTPVYASLELQSDFEVSIPDDVMTKLGQDLIEEISLGTSDSEFDVIVAFDIDSSLDFKERAVENVEGLEVAKTWQRFKMFKASVDTNTLYQIARLPHVSRIDNNTRAKVACLNWARYYTGVNYLHYYHPSMDGNTDGSTTTYTKNDVVIAILDTGIHNAHYDLDGGKVIGWVDLIGDQYGVKQSTPYDDHGHGTHCASIAAGSGDASSSYRGVARYAALVGVKMMDYQGYSTKEIAIDALEWVGDNRNTYGIEIASCSWGFFDYGDYDVVAQAADDLAYFDNIVVVVAAGNEGEAGIRNPGTAKWVTTVGWAIDPYESGDDWELHDDSARGPCDDQRIKPDILAPGTDIYSAKAGTYNQYEDFDGTSAATPFVAGTVAILLDKYPLYRYDYDADYNSDIKQLLMASAVDMPEDDDPGVDNDFGAGRIDALASYFFIERDVSTWSTDAPLVISYQDTSYHYYNEPLWCRDDDYRTDWFKVNVYSDWFIWAMAYGDPDLLLQVRIYDKYLNLKAQSSVGNDRSAGYWSTYSGAYYIRIQSMQNTGDYYDLSLITTASA